MEMAAQQSFKWSVTMYTKVQIKYFNSWSEFNYNATYDLFGLSVAATLIFETVLIFKVGLEAFCMTFFDSSLSLFNKTWNLIDEKL
jgi:hypothetical protein